MSYAIDPNAPPGEELGRVMAEQVRKLIAECDKAQGDPAAFVHKARVRCKKIRATLRLARPLMGDKAYRHENRWWRDAARGLSGVRDLTARIEALEALRGFLEAEAGEGTVARLAAQFARDHAAFSRADGGSAAVAQFCEQVRARQPVASGAIAEGSADDIMDGLSVAYARARRAMKAALEEGSPELMHEWRKQAKYHALQMRLARKLFSDALQPRIEETRDLAELLGHMQDIEVMREAVANGDETRITMALGLRRKQLTDQARETGERLFSDKPKRWARGTLLSAPTDPATTGA